MDIFDRLGTLIRSLVDEDDDASGDTGRFVDPDMQAAWSELEGYINEGRQTASPPPRRPATSGMPEWLRKDYRSLELPPGAPLPEVKRAYKKLMAAYHPDRHSVDQERMRAATEVTKRLNQSYNRIMEYYTAQAGQRPAAD